MVCLLCWLQKEEVEMFIATASYQCVTCFCIPNIPSNTPESSSWSPKFSITVENVSYVCVFRDVFDRIIPCSFLTRLKNTSVYYYACFRL